MSKSKTSQTSRSSRPERSEREDFQREAETSQPGIVAEFLYFLVEYKAWWLAPIIVCLLLLSLIAFFGGTVAAPFIYPF